MKIQDFSLNNTARFASYFMLKKITSNSENIDVYLEIPTGRLACNEGFSAYKMQDGSVVLSSMFPWMYRQSNNFIATNGIEEEIVQSEFFEQVETIHKKLPSNTEGMFCFCDSVKASLNPVDNFQDIIKSVRESRCDVHFFGPDDFGVHAPYVLTNPPETLISYEKILSVNGVAHIIFLHASGDDSEVANNYINRNHIPHSARTFTECLKLITEWAETTEEPWNNQSNIAQKAKQFIDKIEFTEEFIQQIKDNQVDMQVVQYLLGSQDARQRPQNVKEMFPEVTTYLGKNQSHLSLAGLIKFYPTAWDYKEVLKAEIANYDKNEPVEFSKYQQIPDGPIFGIPHNSIILKKQKLHRLLSELS